MEEHRATLSERGLTVRGAAFTSTDPARDILRVASDQSVDLLLLGAPAALVETGQIGNALDSVLTSAACDVGILFPGSDGALVLSRGHPVLVPFGAASHDWAALELGAWIATAFGTSLKLVGTRGEREDRRDPSRLLAHVSLAVQRATGVAAVPSEIVDDASGILKVGADAGLIVGGLSERRTGELGAVRTQLVQQAATPVLLMRKGLRPSGIAPSESLTRFTWSRRQLDAGL